MARGDPSASSRRRLVGNRGSCTETYQYIDYTQLTVIERTCSWDFSSKASFSVTSEGWVTVVVVDIINIVSYSRIYGSYLFQFTEELLCNNVVSRLEGVRHLYNINYQERHPDISTITSMSTR